MSPLVHPILYTFVPFTASKMRLFLSLLTISVSITARLITPGRFETDSSELDAVVIDSPNGSSEEGTTKSANDEEDLLRTLCPQQNSTRYDPKSQTCGTLETKSHCGLNMIFKEEQHNSAYGYCDCNFEAHDVPLVYHLLSDSCYPIYSQAYCTSPSDWLVLSKEAKGPVCQGNRCLRPANNVSNLIFSWIWRTAKSDGAGVSPEINNGDNLLDRQSQSTLVPLHGTGPCVHLGMSSDHCDSPKEKVIIPPGEIVPQCGVPGKAVRRLLIVNACPPGSYYSIIGYCQPDWEF